MPLLRRNVPDALVVLGLATILVGCALVSIPLALIVAGALLIALVLIVGAS